LDETNFWVGHNATDISGNTTGVAPFRKQHIGISRGTMSLSLLEDFGFACSNGPTDFFAKAHATIQKRGSSSAAEERKEIHSPEIISFALSCSQSTYEKRSNQTTDETFLPSDMSTTITSLPLTDERTLVQDQCRPLKTRSGIDFGLSEDFVTRITKAFELTTIVLEADTDAPEWRTEYELFASWSDWNDKVLLAKPHDESICYVAFRKAQTFNPLDRVQSLDPRSMPVDGSDCAVRRGYHQSYFSSFVDDFKSGLDRCVQACSDGDCPVILTGQSQGGGKLVHLCLFLIYAYIIYFFSLPNKLAYFHSGTEAIAVVASIDLRAYNPTTITFGGMSAILKNQGRCTDIDTGAHFRFISTLNGTWV
jgi:hypothetical protein